MTKKTLQEIRDDPDLGVDRSNAAFGDLGWVTVGAAPRFSEIPLPVNMSDGEAETEKEPEPEGPSVTFAEYLATYLDSVFQKAGALAAIEPPKIEI